jgi:ABC-2 type transport system permease protein
MGNFSRGIIRASSFFRKEIFEILRQPRLVATLVLGPFLILFIFGIGYHDQPRSFRTLFVVQPNSAISSQDIQQYGKSVDLLIVYAGVTDNQNEALGRLRRGEVDLVIVVPVDAIGTIENNQQAVFTLYHQQIDPAQVTYVNYLGWLYVGEVNQQVLRSFALQGQKDAINWHTSLQEAHQNVSAMRQAMQSGNEALAQQKQQELAGNVDAVSLAVGTSLGLLDSLQQTKGTNGGNTDPAQSTLTDLRQNTNELGNSTDSKDERLTRLDKIDKDITDLDGKLAEFQSIDPSIIVSPFRNKTKSVATAQPSISDFFAPAVLALLLQHLAVTFAALSIVRERNVGTMELFRVSPLSAAEALFGKYISYMLFGGVIAVILSGLLVFVMHVPMLGNWWYFTLVIAAVLFTSLGIGFVISIVSQTDSQAVQYSMIILLASVFFSGFIMSLDMLLPSVRWSKYKE